MLRLLGELGDEAAPLRVVFAVGDVRHDVREILGEDTTGDGHPEKPDRLRIHDKDTVPPGAAIFPMRIESGRYLYTKFPVTVIRGRDTLKTDREILIDYGSTSALWFEHSPLHSDPAVMEFFTSSTQPQAVEKEWCEEFTLMADKIILPDGMGTLTSSTDNLKISLTVLNEEYYYEESALKYPAAIMGIGILRHWNVMLDLRNKRLILFPGARATVNTAAPSST